MRRRRKQVMSWKCVLLFFCGSFWSYLKGERHIYRVEALHRRVRKHLLTEKQERIKQFILCEFEKPLSCFARCLYLPIRASSIGGWSGKQQLGGVVVVAGGQRGEGGVGGGGGGGGWGGGQVEWQVVGCLGAGWLLGRPGSPPLPDRLSQSSTILIIILPMIRIKATVTL